MSLFLSLQAGRGSCAIRGPGTDASRVGHRRGRALDLQPWQGLFVTLEARHRCVLAEGGAPGSFNKLFCLRPVLLYPPELMTRLHAGFQMLRFLVTIEDGYRQHPYHGRWVVLRAWVIFIWSHASTVLLVHGSKHPYRQPVLMLSWSNRRLDLANACNLSAHICIARDAVTMPSQHPCFYTKRCPTAFHQLWRLGYGA